MGRHAHPQRFPREGDRQGQALAGIPVRLRVLQPRHLRPRDRPLLLLHRLLPRQLRHADARVLKRQKNQNNEKGTCVIGDTEDLRKEKVNRSSVTTATRRKEPASREREDNEKRQRGGLDAASAWRKVASEGHISMHI